MWTAVSDGACGVRQGDQTTGHLTPNAEAMPIRNQLQIIALQKSTPPCTGQRCRQSLPVTDPRYGIFCRTGGRVSARAHSVPTR